MNVWARLIALKPGEELRLSPRHADELFWWLFPYGAEARDLNQTMRAYDLKRIDYDVESMTYVISRNATGPAAAADPAPLPHPVAPPVSDAGTLPRLQRESDPTA